MGKTKLFSVTVNDCKVETFTVGGAGGGGKDTSNSGVRITHPPSGASGVGKDHRSQFKNKQDAFTRMAKSKQFQVWCKLKASELSGQPSVDSIVDEMMQGEHLKIETFKDNKWTPDIQKDLL